MDFSLTKEQEMIKKEIARFCKKELTNEYVSWMDENVDFIPDDLWNKFVDIGFFRSCVSREYGGDGLGVLDMCIVLEEIYKASLSVGTAVGCNACFGVRFIHELGTEEMRRDLLPKLCDGKIKVCMALTEPGGGTDILGALSTFAEEKEDRWVINGEKIFITTGHVSDYMVTFCKTEEGKKKSKSLSVFLVPSKSKGITITRIPKISLHHCDSVGITFNDVEVPKDSMLGTRGNGWSESMTVLNPERIYVAVMGVAVIAACYEASVAYAQQRQAFGGPISRFQILQKYMADMLINLENARNLTHKAAWLCDHGKPYHKEATMAKLVAAEGALHAGIHGAEIFGGYGVCKEYPMQRYLRDSLQMQFSPISNEMARNMLMQFEGLPKSWA